MVEERVLAATRRIRRRIDEATGQFGDRFVGHRRGHVLLAPPTTSAGVEMLSLKSHELIPGELPQPGIERNRLLAEILV